MLSTKGPAEQMLSHSVLSYPSLLSLNAASLSTQRKFPDINLPLKEEAREGGRKCFVPGRAISLHVWAIGWDNSQKGGVPALHEGSPGTLLDAALLCWAALLSFTYQGSSHRVVLTGTTES